MSRLTTVDPRLTAVLGGLCISLASMFIHFSNTPAPTSAFWRCLIAFPVLLALYARERRTERRAGAGTGPKPTLVPLLAGAALGVDFVLWAEGIRMVGAGISTVLLSVQVVIVPTAAYLLHGERTSRRFVATVPVLLLGVVLAGGLAGTPVTGADPLGGALASLGAGTAYAFYLLLVRRGGGGVRALLLATVSAGAVAVAFGVPTGQLDLTPGWASLGWLAALALIGQIVGWLLISAALPRMPSSTGAALMLVQPVGSVVLGIALMGERPNAVQLVGCAAVLLAVYAGTRAPRATGELDRPERAADDPAAEPVQTGPEPATPANLGART